VRWFVDNRCGVLEGQAGAPALKVAHMTPRERGHEGWFDLACSASLSRVDRGSPLDSDVKNRPPGNVIVCSIPNDAALEGLYKYSLDGRIVPLDPGLEVIPPSGPP
jgi:hypothetical protein